MPGPTPERTEPDTEAARIARVYEGYRVAGRGSLYDPSNPGNRAILRERLRWTRRALQRAGLANLRGRRVLDVGCGVGRELARMQEFGAASADLVGVDLLPDRIETARRTFPDLEFRVANAVELGFPDAFFDLILSFTLFSSILDQATAGQVAAEIVRVLRHGGAVLWYDLRVANPRNPNVQGLTSRRVRALFPELCQHLRTITLAPPLARKLGPTTPATYPLLAALPFVRTHLVGSLVKPTR